MLPYQERGPKVTIGTALYLRLSAVSTDDVAESASTRASCSAPAEDKGFFPSSSRVLVPPGSILLHTVMTPFDNVIEQVRGTSAVSNDQTLSPRFCPLLIPRESITKES
jgi:hypothetical protein